MPFSWDPLVWAASYMFLIAAFVVASSPLSGSRAFHKGHWNTYAVLYNVACLWIVVSLIGHTPFWRNHFVSAHP